MDSVKELLNDPVRGQKRAQGILCYLFRNILLWRDVRYINWNKRLNQYFEKPHNKNKPVDKGNLNKTLIADDMTWGSFMKAIDFLSPVAATLQINLTWRDGTTSAYVIALDPAEDESDPKLNTFEPNDSEIFAQVKQRGDKKPPNTLARLFRHIVTQEVKDDLVRWNQLFEDFVNSPINGLEQNRRDTAGQVSALQRSMLDNRLTWNTFRKGLQVLNPAIEEYLLTMRWTNDPNIIKHSPDFAISEHVARFRDPFAEGIKANDLV